MNTKATNNELQHLHEERPFDISSLTPVATEWGVYILFDGYEVVYVGHSRFPLSRIGKHSETKKFDGFKIIPHSEIGIVDAEAILIVEHMPKYNGSLPKCNKFISLDEASIVYGTSKKSVMEKTYSHGIFPIRMGKWSYFLRNEIMGLMS